MAGILTKIPVYLLAGWAFVNAYSRYTEGHFLPELYDFQKSHELNDGLTVDQLSPFLDVILGLLVILPKTRYAGCLASVVWMGMCLGLQFRAGKPYLYDAILVFVANMAVTAAGGGKSSILGGANAQSTETEKPEAKKE